MQQQVMKRNAPSELGWGSGEGGGWGQQTSAPGSGSWTSTANQDSSATASTWQPMGKSDSASDAGDDSSSVKPGSAITSMSNMTSQENSTNNSSALQSNSSSLWSASNQTLTGMDSSPWGNSGSSAASSMWSIPSSLSFSTNPGHNNGLQGTMMNNSSAFNSSGTGSSGWPSSMANNSLTNTSNLPPNLGGSGTGNGSSSISSHWSGSSMLGTIGDFSKTEWNNPTTPIDTISKEIGGANSDPRHWGLSSDKSGDAQWDINKPQWGNPSPSDQSASNTELSFAQATLKGLKAPTSNPSSQSTISLRQEEILRAIENHEGWGSRPIRQDTSWDVETSPKSHRKFSTDSTAGASNVWNNSNGTAIWEAVRENQAGNWTGGNSSGNTWNAEKDQPNWSGPPKPPQEPTWNVGNGNDPKAFGTWGAAGAAGDASNKMWGQKTEVGSWGESPGNQRTTSISSWGDDGETAGWEDPQRRVGGMQGMVPPSPGLSGPVSNIPSMIPQAMPGLNVSAIGSEVAPWNDAQKQGWNPNVGMNRTKMDEPWNKPPPRSGWGDPQQDNKVDDGTSIWAANAPKQIPPQVKPSGWPEGAQGQWNAVGTKPKAPAGWDETSWALAQRAKSGRLPDDVSANSVEVGYWNGLPQDNSTWNDPAALRGVRKITGQQMPPKYVSGNNNPPNQMRAKLLQELMDMGYRREEAQNALIVNNLNLKLALNYLKTTNGGMSRKDLDMDVFQSTPSQSRLPYMPQAGMGSDDLPEMRPDQVPPFNSLQNTQFPTSQVPNQPFMQSSLQTSGLNASTSINSSLQQKLMVQKMQAPPTPTLGPRGQIAPVGSSSNNQAPPQQQQQLLDQQQILDQLRQAVNNGFISPQLLNYQLPHNILVLLQQLLQLQSALQRMVAKHQQLTQQARATGSHGNAQVEQMAGIINSIKQQIITLQKQLQQAQSSLFSTQKPPNMSHPPAPTSLLASQTGQQPPLIDNNLTDSLTSELANVSLQPQSRLQTKWQSSNDPASDGNIGSSSTNAGDESSDMRATKSLLQSSSSPNLNLIPGGLGMTGDKTWSTNLSTTSSNWPLSSTDSIGTSAQSDLKMSSTITSASSILAGMPSGLTDVIPEFIPGKPWQGLTKNVEDDPHVTPGSIQLQRSLSVNRVHDDSLNNLDGHKLNTSNSWGSGFKNDTSLGLSQLGNPGNRPPPVMVPNKAGNQQWQSGGFNRQASWPHSASSAFTKVGPSNWNDSRTGITAWVVLKNIGSSIDTSTVRSLCAQHGALTNFYHVAQAQLALVQYSSRDSALNAQQRLNNFAMGSSTIMAELISDAEAQRYVAQIPHPQANVLPPMNTSPWSQAPPSAPYQRGDPWGNSMPTSQPLSKYSTGGEHWNLWDISDHNSNPILNNILGSESM
ncbi:trinucleotide repeat-containing 6C protein-like isoform X1 [Biomphalaria glabrata]|uniref:Trinucleotide repeat-containing gene 6C protein-like isoform X1 n=1 Tax=Biomphalaria glabrata TaxID=6526 RepID=A0A2C9JP53_BIOGL|nr:trinucleotide repeat-containing gene 6C protein-like isoform X1 [Biomphalaria glabrata]KAI8731422.1 trinucleotide repeat-containing gene 6C protein-like isoform X1 [Biomphalaria glabrata]KAI8796443.1 trinucleotide repeat-containing gene 6C protein isoform X1 [Biomphalaria glabrata]